MEETILKQFVKQGWTTAKPARVAMARLLRMVYAIMREIKEGDSITGR